MPGLEWARFASAALAAGAVVSSSGPSSAALLAAPQANLHAGHAAADERPCQCTIEPARERKSFFDLTDAELRLLCSAVGYMRSGSTDRPLSIDNQVQWDQFALTHTRHCTEAGPGTYSQVHWSWFFLPWHRAYLWFLERHLASIITNVFDEDGSAFALPY
ncbi:MAG: tyrosinase family protein, partial [Polyangiaceae bacterium]